MVGHGLPSDAVGSAVSDKAAYVSPTRGAQGNALKTALAIPYVLSGARPSVVTIEARGLRHEIRVATDHIARRPQIEHMVAEIAETKGTTIRISLDSACLELPVEEGGFLQELVFDYSLFNPHASFRLDDGEFEALELERTANDWTKWLPSDPTSAHWYNAERLENLIGSFIAAERTGGRARTVREFVSEFRGLSGSAKQKQVMREGGTERAYLHDLGTGGGSLNRSALERLLAAMQEFSSPVKPDGLGVLGEQHFRQRLLVEGDPDARFRYGPLSCWTVFRESDQSPKKAVCSRRLSRSTPLYGRADFRGTDWRGLMGNTDRMADSAIPLSGVGEIASVLAKGFLRHRRSLRLQAAGDAAVGGSVSNALAFRAEPSRHVTVVNDQRTDEN
jgi:hypothetical protein